MKIHTLERKIAAGGSTTREELYSYPPSYSSNKCNIKDIECKYRLTDAEVPKECPLRQSQ